MDRSILLLAALLAAGSANAESPRRAEGRITDDPHRLISDQALIEVVEELVSVRAFDGFRTTTTPGELEALDLVAARLAGMTRLGIEHEQQRFHVPFGLVPREDRLWLSVAGVEHEVPASSCASSCSYERIALLDSDGVVGDLEPDPVTVTGAVVLAATPEEAQGLAAEDVADRVLVLDYSAIDQHTGDLLADYYTERDTMRHIVAIAPAAVVMVTRFSDVLGDSNGIDAAQARLERHADQPLPPRMVVRLEDLAPLGITSWEDLSVIDEATVRWDADVVAPGESGNLVATIPGRDRDRALILGAHIDSPNSPGALDDGSGVAVLVEVARVLDQAQVEPPVDVVLAFFGNEEGGLSGSAHFANTHGELLDRCLAMLQVDCLTSPMEGLPRAHTLDAVVPAVASGARLPWPDYLASVVQRRWLWPLVEESFIESDNGAFRGFDVPNANLIFWDFAADGGPWYAGHLHSPYDDLPMVLREIDALRDMVHVALAAALRTGVDDPVLRQTPSPDRRAVFVASHTEGPYMAPAGLRELCMALAWSGFDVDVVPYGTPVAAGDLIDADLVVTMPVIDLAPADSDPLPYDEAWREDELDALETYAEQGGLLALTHACGLMTGWNSLAAGIDNEDRAEDNVLAARFGVEFDLEAAPITRIGTRVVGDHPLVAALLESPYLGNGTGVPVIHTGTTLLESSHSLEPVMAAVPIGDSGGEVLAVGDLGLLADNLTADPRDRNVQFWLCLADYARSRGRLAASR